MTDQNPLYDADRRARILTLARNLDLDLDPDLDFDLDFDLIFILTLDLGLDLTRDFACALNLGLDLTRVAARVVARDRARTLDRALALARARAFARDLARDRTLAYDLARTLACDLARALGRTRDLARARALAHDLAHDLDRLRALGRARDFARALGCDRALARTLSRALAHDLDRDCARAFAHDPDLDRLRQALYRINAFIDQGEQLDASAKAKAEPAPVARSAERLVDVVMRLLPAQHRSRYTEEFKAELYDLAQAKATATVQVVYALQQLSRVWRLREALLTPDRPRFHRLHRTACWVLATETRTWTPLTGLLLWGGAETALDTGPGTAILLVAGSGAVLQAGVTWGRNRLGVEVRQRKSTE